MKGRNRFLNLLTLVIYLFFFYGLIFCKKKEVVSQPIFLETKDVIKKGETVELVLERLLDDRLLINQILDLLHSCNFPFRRCLPGDSIIILKKDGKFQQITYYRHPTIAYYIFNVDSFFTLAMKYPYIEKSNLLIAGAIQSTLYESMIKIGETPELVYRFADILAWEIDFTTETQNGDSFYILVEKSFCDSQFIGYSHIQMVRYKGFIGDYFGIYYKNPDGYDDFYNLKGESLRKALLKSPLKYSHISSYFSKRRFHPILKIWRPHHGLDYSAPTGTPVSSVGDGIITYKGWKGGYGNLVEIRHKNNFKTRYGHLSRFAKGIYVGKRVKIGELIGYVGSTGLSTGPHLHFELHKEGVPINPLTVRLPRAPSVKREYLKEFEQLRDSMLVVIADTTTQSKK